MTTKFSITPESSDVSDYLLSKEDVAKYKLRDGVDVPDNTKEYIDLINSEIERVYSGSNESDMAISVSAEDFIYDLRLLGKSSKNGSPMYRTEGDFFVYISRSGSAFPIRRRLQT